MKHNRDRKFHLLLGNLVQHRLRILFACSSKLNSLGRSVFGSWCPAEGFEPTTAKSSCSTEMPAVSAGISASHTNRIHNSRPSSGAAAHRSPCSRRSRDTRRSAWIPQNCVRTPDMSEGLLSQLALSCFFVAAVKPSRRLCTSRAKTALSSFGNFVPSSFHSWCINNCGCGGLAAVHSASGP
jgi:hypothetical protein